MIGTQDYTAIGRPNVTKARVFATVEEVSQTEKVIYFKMKRRKGYQRNGGHRQTINMLRIDKIEHSVTDTDFQQNAVMLKHPQETLNIIL